MQAYRWFASFDEDVARAPRHLDEWARHPTRNSFSERENKLVKEATHRALSDCYDHLKPASRKMVELDTSVGFALECCSYTQYVHRDGVHALFAGEVASWPDFSAIEQAHNAFVRGEDEKLTVPDEANWLVNYYTRFRDSNALDLTDAVLEALNRVDGTFAFLVFDESLQRVLIARDKQGATPLYWGDTKDGRFCVGTCLEDLAGCSPSATALPAGCLYASDGPTSAKSPGAAGFVLAAGEHRGVLLSFVESGAPGRRWRDVRAVPRMTEDGKLCGSVYKVASESQLVP